MMSVAMFMLLIKISPTAVERRSTKLNTLVRWVSQNTLPIYLFQIIVIETFQKGLLGFTLNIMTVTPIVMVPLLALIILLVCLGVILPLKKVPLLKRLIG
jgi:fucose 4-O-acetylase-like acetyltransferase